MSSSQAPKLLLRNATAMPVRVRFHCGEHALADLWIAASGSVKLPEARGAALLASVSFADPETAVDYTASLRCGSAGASVAASFALLSGAPCLRLRHEELGPAGLIQLRNDTVGEVVFDLRWEHSPFALKARLKAGAVDCIAPHRMRLSAVVEGKTPSPLDVLAWDEVFVIEMDDAQRPALPRLRRA